MPSSGTKQKTDAVHHLVLVLGDQLNADSAAFDDFDNRHDAVWMAEVADESTHVWTHKARIVMFLAAMRHLRERLEKEGRRVEYRRLPVEKDDGPDSLSSHLEEAIKRLGPEKLIIVEPGEYRVQHALQTLAGKLDVPLEIRTDRHFFTTKDDFADFARGRKELRLEYFYRQQRKRTELLMEAGEPAVGRWNFDKDNRESFGRDGPGEIPPPRRFEPDKVTREVIELVDQRFADHPGSADEFDFPVTPKQARQALEDFIEHRLPRFGDFQDAMWTDEPLLYHSRLSAAMNLKLLDPREVVDAAIAAYETGDAPLNAVEGFVRQILGWREFIRGVYWHFMPEYLNRNELQADRPLPDFYWTGETEMNCLRQAIGQTLRHGYAHHIQRLMVTGLFAMLLGVEPQQVHRWYLAVYVDAVEWVELPNSLGMSQFGDGGVMASKPYAATGKYIKRMSNYCDTCRFDPDAHDGENACPFTVLYWDFLQRHRKKLERNQRMSLQVRNLDRKTRDELKEIRRHAAQIVEELT